ncbi:retrovirus-related Pol polyprotein from transposon TNT 1-94 [Trichonephila clavipes]|nr:retrovirus-related Pol polyprotein from transposon TNT 1-94 [Trichonephila clavipes]
MDDILQILREEEATLNLPIKTRMDGINEAFYCKRKNEKQTRLCYICRKSNHLAKDCYYRNKNSPSASQRNNSSRNGHVFTASHREEKLCDNIWILVSGASCHMAKESVWFKNISPEVMDIYLADKNSKMMSQGTGNVSAKTVSTKHCNSINLTITDVSYVPQLRCNLLSVTCLMDKGCKIKSENNCVLIYDKNDKLITKAFKNNGRLEIKLEPMYNSECFTSDQSTNNYEIWHNRLCHLNCKYMRKMKDYIDIDNVNNFTCETCDISKTTSSPRTGRIEIPVLELNDVQNQIPVRRSERLKSKLMSVHLVNNVPNSYFEAENSANWKNWKLAMENELDSLDKHKVWEIVQKPAKSKLIKTKWVYSLKQDDAGKNIKYKARLVAAEETVYVLPPPGYEKLIGDDKVCKLKKSIYGLPQSGRNWSPENIGTHFFCHRFREKRATNCLAGFFCCGAPSPLGLLSPVRL